MKLSAEIAPIESIVESVFAVDPGANMSEAVELRTHLPDLGAYEFIMSDGLVFTEWAVSRRAGYGQAIVTPRE